jgi:hypothetical protein
VEAAVDAGSAGWAEAGGGSKKRALAAAGGAQEEDEAGAFDGQVREVEQRPSRWTR